MAAQSECETKWGWLCDSDTTERVRVATLSEALESTAAGAEGHFYVDNRRCYVDEAVAAGLWLVIGDSQESVDMGVLGVFEDKHRAWVDWESGERTLVDLLKLGAHASLELFRSREAAQKEFDERFYAAWREGAEEEPGARLYEVTWRLVVAASSPEHAKTTAESVLDAFSPREPVASVRLCKPGEDLCRKDELHWLMSDTKAHAAIASRLRKEAVYGGEMPTIGDAIDAALV